MTLPVSACIICKNEAHRIAACLDSLAWCDDIVVVDSGSTDDTIALAQAHAVRPRVLSQPWLGYNPQRRFAAEQCRHPWVLMLDADEECSPQLAQEIAALSESQTADVALFRMPRKNYLAGRYVRCWSPDYQSRLIQRDRIAWDPRPLPEIRRPQPGFREEKLRSPLLHGRTTPYSPTDLNDGAKMAAYAELLAGHLEEKGARASTLNLVIRPLSTFLKYYLFRGGFLDGRFGLVIAYKTTIGVMLKYSVLYGRQELATPETQNSKLKTQKDVATPPSTHP